MNNDKVIEALEIAVQNLKVVINELEDMKRNVGGPVEERATKIQKIISLRSRLTMKVGHLELQLIDRQTARDLNDAVTPLSPEERARIEAGLEALSASVAAVGDFTAAINLASEIANAADGIIGAAA